MAESTAINGSNLAAGNLQEIYNELLAGNRIALHFKSKQEAHYFRIKLHKLKAQQELELLALISDDGDSKRLSMHFDKESGKATFSFVDKPDPKQYSFEIIPPAEDTENA